MSKSTQEELVEEVATELVCFLRDGTINPNYLGAALEYEGIDRIQDIESILRVHFVLSEDVLSFIEELPTRVRRIKTETKKQEIRRKSEVRGRINWSKTLIEQKTSSDPTIFISQNPSRDYNVSENLVLKKLLSIIYHVIESDLKKPLDKDYKWLKGLKEKDVVNHLKNTYRKNVHINRIEDPELYVVSDRDISIAENSRKELYRESAQLLIRYNKLVSGECEKEDLKKLIDETLILPGDIPTLFELYSTFKLLCRLKEDFRLKKISDGTKEIAVFEKENVEMRVYHDSTGGLNFYERIDDIRDIEIENDHLRRYRDSLVKHEAVLRELLGSDERASYSGRPDILVEYYEDKILKKLIIGEVKYSENKQTFSQGLKELIQYIHYCREKSKYSLGTVEIKGIFIQDNIEFLDKEKLKDGVGLQNVDLGFELEILDTEYLKQYRYE